MFWLICIRFQDISRDWSIIKDMIFVQFLCHVTLKLAVSRSRPPAPYGANLLYFSTLDRQLGAFVTVAEHL